MQQGFAGEETGRAAVMDSGAVPHIVASLSDADNAVRLAAVWCACCSAAAQRPQDTRAGLACACLSRSLCLLDVITKL